MGRNYSVGFLMNCTNITRDFVKHLTYTYPKIAHMKIIVDTSSQKGTPPWFWRLLSKEFQNTKLSKQLGIFHHSLNSKHKSDTTFKRFAKLSFLKTSPKKTWWKMRLLTTNLQTGWFSRFQPTCPSGVEDSTPRTTGNLLHLHHLVVGMQWVREPNNLWIQVFPWGRREDEFDPTGR